MTVNECWEYIKNTITKGTDLFIPVINLNKTEKNKPPWLSTSIKKSVKKKYKLFKRYLESKSSSAYHDYIQVRNEVNKLVKNAKYNHEKKIADECKGNPKAFWKYINSFKKCKECVPPLKRKDASLATDDAEKADMLIKYFSSVLTNEDITNIPHIKPGANSNGKMVSEIEVTAEQVEKKLKALNTTKSPGPDKLYPRVLNELSCELSGPLSVLFNKTISNGILPDDWKTAEITAIFKKGDRTDTNNFRPVSLTCILCKVLESFIRDILQRHMEENKLYTKCQHGFRKGKSCTTQLLEVINDFTNYMDDGTPFDTIYLDFKKAFDSVPHSRLLVKLRSYGIDGKLYQWIKSFLSDRSQYVKVGASCSKTMNVTSGIPQGSILGPILFLIFINDLPDCVESTCHIFADDTKVYNTGNNTNSLQKDLKALQEWSNKWQLHFNCSKCKCLHFGMSNTYRDYYFKNENGNKQYIPTCTEEKDLGVIFDDSLKFDLHINCVVKKANSLLGLIRRNFQFIDKGIFNKLYKALVRPHLEYGQIIWSPHLIRQSKLIENVQRRATKMVESITNLSYEQRLKALKLPSLKYRRIRGDLIQVYKFLSEDQLDYRHILPLSSNPYFTKGHDLKLKKARYNTLLKKCSFSYRVVNYWNKLNPKTVHANNTNTFKKLLDVELKCIHYKFD